MQPSTVADQRLYLDDGYVPVLCIRCAAQVRVRKHSAKQTSVQWPGDAAGYCPEIAARVEAGVPGALVESCSMIRQSIEMSVLAGAVVVPDE